MRQGVFGACAFGLIFERFSLGPPFEEFQKMAVLVSLRNWSLLRFAGTFRAPVCGTMFSDDCSSRAYYLIEGGICGRVFFGACEFGLLFERFSVAPRFQEFLKNGRFSCFCKIGHCSAGTFRAEVCGTMLSDDCTLTAY